MNVPLDGGAPTTIAIGQSSLWGVAVDSTSVYWTDWATEYVGTVMKAPK
jgi:hypothetical protein